MSEETASTQDEKHENNPVEETQEDVENTSEDKVTEEEVIEEVPQTEEDPEDAPVSRRDERIQELVETNKQLMDLLKTRAFTPSQRESVEPDIPAFEDPDVEKAFNAKLTKERQRLQGQLGTVAEELDAVRFDRVLVKEGIEEDSKEYEKITTKLQSYREEQAALGHYFKRADAYAILKTKGIFTPKAKPVKKVTVIKTKPNVAIQQTTKKSAKLAQKTNFNQLSLEEKEKALESAKF